MKAYISGKISGLTESEYKENFKNAVHEVWIKSNDLYYVDIINPIHVKPFLGIKHWLCYMINDIRKQKTCTHSAFQKNWVDSKGAVIEYFLAKFIFKQTIIFL
jgi:hypothetical protein